MPRRHCPAMQSRLLHRPCSCRCSQPSRRTFTQHQEQQRQRRAFSCSQPAAAPLASSPSLSSSSPPAMSPSSRPLNLLNLTRAQLAAHLQSLGHPAYRASQLFHLIYRKGVTSFPLMLSLPSSLRSLLHDGCSLDCGQVLARDESREDGTRKLLLGLGDQGKDRVETVFIPMRERGGEDAGSGAVAGTVCISSQVACSQRCAFCATGAMDKSRMRNLTAGEIVAQVVQTLRDAGDYSRALPASHLSSAASSTLSSSSASAAVSDAVSNIVFMGMGEPGNNMRAVCAALDILSDHHGLAYGRKRITVSTSGVVPAIDRLRPFGVRLAVSLHAARDELRDRLMPINRQWPLHELMCAVRRYQHGEDGDRQQAARGSQQRVTFEYCLMRGVNDSLSDARELCRLLRRHDIDALINLIPFNAWSGSGFESSTDAAIYAFADECGRSTPTTIRWPKGRDINAACGQLAARSSYSVTELPPARPERVVVAERESAASGSELQQSLAL